MRLRRSVERVVKPEHGENARNPTADLASGNPYVAQASQPLAHASPLETAEPDDIASLTPDEFFADMPAIDDLHG